MAYLSAASQMEGDARRLAEVHRLSCAGLSADQIAKALTHDLETVTVEQVYQDLYALEHIKQGYTDSEQMRASIALDIDRVFHSIMAELQVMGSKEVRPATRALYYKEARESLRQKADLFGLNSATVNLGAQGKLWAVLQELRNNATELDAEADRLQISESDALPFAVAAPAGLLVESNPDYRG